MNNRINCLNKTTFLILSVVNLCCFGASAQTTAFSYQGRLTDAGTPANGVYDMTFTLFGTSSGGSSIAGPLTNAPTSVTNGLFTVALDFGQGVFPGPDRWLELGVRTFGSAGAYQTLSPRRKLTSAPYSIMAANAGSLGGQPAASFAPSSGSSSYVAKAGDTMNGALHLPSDGLSVGGSQLTLFGGNVGIGTSNPIRPLEAGRTNSGGIQTMAHFGSPIATGNAGDGAAITIGTGNGAGQYYAKLAAVNEFSSPSFLNPALTFSTMRGTYLAGSEVERMRISSDGLVGIGKTNPATALDVNGTVTATNFIGSGAGLTNIAIPTTHNFVFAYDTHSQTNTGSANSYIDLVIGNDAQIDGWTHTAGTAFYTNTQAGLYLIQYTGEALVLSGSTATASMRGAINEVGVSGSQAAVLPGTAGLVSDISRSFIASFTAGDAFSLQLAGSTANNAVLAGTGSGSPRPSVSLTITRIQ